MPAPLGSAIFQEVVALLLPEMESEQSRRAFLAQLFIGIANRPSINISGTPEEATWVMVEELWQYGGIQPGKPALVAALELLRDRVGVEKQNQIKILIPALIAEAIAKQTEDTYEIRPKGGNARRLALIGAGMLALILAMLAVLSGTGGQPPKLPTNTAGAVVSSETPIPIPPTVTPSETATLTPTPTATSSPIPRAVAATLRVMFITQTVEAYTDTPTITPTSTEDFQATVFAELTSIAADELTATATLWTLTPTPTATATPSPTLTLTATLTPSPTLTPTATLTPSPTLTPTATLTHTQTPRPTETPAITPVPTVSVDTQSAWQPFEQTFNGVVMVLVPPGCFLMGERDTEEEESPVHQICFTEPFWIDKFEVTNGQFSTLGGTAGRSSANSGVNRPRERINWSEALDFCTLRGARLPTEAEWEYAARGPASLRYPWGNRFNLENVVMATRFTADVGSRPGGASWVGTQDMVGNVREWVSTIFAPYPYRPDDGREGVENRTNTLRGVRGESHQAQISTILRAALRGRNFPTSVNTNHGFRCAMGYKP